jgi:WD40 repeat protein
LGGRVELRSRQEPDQVIVELRGQSEEPVEVAISPNGRRIAWCTPTGQLTVWSTADRRPELEADLSKESPVSVHKLDFSPDSQWLWACSSRAIFVADFKTGQVGVARTQRSANFSTAAVSPDGQSLVVSHNDGQIDQYEPLPLKEGQRPRMTFNTLRLNVRPDVMLYLPQGDSVAVGAGSGLVAILDLKDGKARMFRGHTEPVTCLAHSPDGKWLYSASSRGEVLRWDPTVTDQRATIVAGKKLPTEEQLAYSCVDFSPDGRWLALAGRWVWFDDKPAAGELLVLDAATRQVARRVGVPDGVHSCRFTSDSRRVVYGSAQVLHPGRFWIADLPSLESPREIVLAGRSLFAAAPLADGRIALASDDAVVRLWSPQSGSVTGEWRPALPRTKSMSSEMFGLVASHGGQHVLSHAEDGLVRLWESPEGRELLVAPCNLGQEPLAVSPGGSLAAWTAANPGSRLALEREGLVTAPEVPWLSDFEEKAIVFDVARRQVRFVVAGHTSGLKALAFSPDGRRLATGDARGYIKLWDTGTGHEVLTLEAHLNNVAGIAFHPDGMQMATVGADGLVRIWPRK